MKTGKLDTTFYLKPSKDSTIFYHTYPYNGTFSAMIVEDKDESIWITDSLPGQKRTYKQGDPAFKWKYYNLLVNPNKKFVCHYTNSKSNEDYMYLSTFNEPDNFTLIKPLRDSKGNLTLKCDNNGEVLTVSYGGAIHIYYIHELIWNVDKVAEGGVAAKSGLKINDKIISRNKQKISLVNEKFTKIIFEVIRDNDTISLTMDKGTEEKFGFEINLTPNHILSDTSITNLGFISILNKDLLYFNNQKEKIHWYKEYTPKDIVYSLSKGKVVLELGKEGVYEEANIDAIENNLIIGEIIKTETKEKYKIVRHLRPFNDLTKKIELPEKTSSYSAIPSLVNKDIILLSKNGEWAIYSIKNKRILQKFETLRLESAELVALNPKKNGFCVTNDEDLIQFDMQGKITKKKIGTLGFDIEQMQFDTSGNYLFCMSSDDLTKWDLKENKQLYNYDPEDKYGNTNLFANEDLSEIFYVYANINSSGLVNLNPTTGDLKLYSSVHLHQEFPPPALLVIEKNRFKKNEYLIGLSNGIVRSLTREQLDKYYGEDYTDKWNPILSIHYLDTKRAIAAREDGSALLFKGDFTNSEDFTLAEEKITTVIVDAKAKEPEIYFAGTKHITLQKKAFDSNKILWTIDAKYGIQNMKLNWDRQFIIATCSDGKIRFIRTSNGEEIIQLYFFADSDEYLITTTDSYFYSSREIAKLLQFKFDGQDMANNEGDVRFNRPDIILERLGYADPDLNKKLKRLWEKRMRKNGYSIASNKFNSIHINKVEYDPSNLLNDQTISMEVFYNDPIKNANNLIVYHNGSLIKELPLIANSKSAKISLNFINGTNDFTFFIKSSDNLMSRSYDIKIHNESLTQKTNKPEFYFIGMACDKYSDSTYNLSFAEKDVTDAEQFFRQNASNNFHSLKVTGKELTSDVINKVSTFVSTAMSDDIIVVYFAGHGMLDADLNYYLSSSLTNFQNPKENSIPMAELENILNQSKSVNRLLFLDACHSGEIDKHDITGTTTSNQKNNIKFRGNNGLKTAGAKDENMLMNEFFNDVRLAAGMNIISSSEGAELSMEGGDWENGLFTYTLKKALNDQTIDLDKNFEITVSEFAIYLNKEVSSASQGKQNPGLRYLNPNNDFVLFTLKE